MSHVPIPFLERLFQSIFEYDDYASIAFTATETSYVVGTNANAAEAESWPSGVPAKDILFFATQDCLVRFEGPSRVQHFIPANTYVRFRRRCFRFYVVRDTVDGTLRVWIEG